MDEISSKSRREFLKTAGKVAVTVPAASLILSAASKPALASVSSGDSREQKPSGNVFDNQFGNQFNRKNRFEDDGPFGGRSRSRGR